MDTKLMILDLLKTAKDSIAQANQLMTQIEPILELEDGEIGLKPEFEEYAFEINTLIDAIREIKDDRDGKLGKLDELEATIKDKVILFFQAKPKLKKYEGDKVVIGYRETARKVILDEKIVDPRFIKIKKDPNTETIDAFIKSTTDDEHPQGQLPAGIGLNKFQYISFKNVSDE